MGKGRNRDGRFTPEHTDAEILSAVRAHEPAATSEVAEELGMTRQGADRRLRRLRDGGHVSSKKIGASLVWFAPTPAPDQMEAPGGAESAEASGGEERRATPVPEDERREGTSERPSGLGGVEFPGGRSRDECEAAVYAACDYLREQGSASMREIVTEVMPDHPLGYDVPNLEPGDRYRGSWWRKVVKPGLKALDDVAAPAGGGEWRYTGDADA